MDMTVVWAGVYLSVSPTLIDLKTPFHSEESFCREAVVIKVKANISLERSIKSYMG